MLNEYEQKKYDTISKFVSKEINLRETMDLLNLTERQIYRLKKIYVENGKEGFIHKSRDKANFNKKDDKLIEKLEALYLEEYHDYNFEHFYEDVLYGNYNISYAIMLKYFTNDDIISPLAHKETVRSYNDKMKNTVKDNENNIKSKK